LANSIKKFAPLFIFFEPNFKQCTVNLYSKNIPQGITMKESEIAGEISYQTTKVTTASEVYQTDTINS